MQETFEIEDDKKKGADENQPFLNKEEKLEQINNNLARLSVNPKLANLGNENENLLLVFDGKSFDASTMMVNHITLGFTLDFYLLQI